jgi:hypothetical protein
VRVVNEGRRFRFCLLNGRKDRRKSSRPETSTATNGLAERSQEQAEPKQSRASTVCGLIVIHHRRKH